MAPSTGTIERAQVLDASAEVLANNARVAARNGHVIKEDAVRGIAADGGHVVLELKGGTSLRTLDDGQDGGGDAHMRSGTVTSLEGTRNTQVASAVLSF